MDLQTVRSVNDIFGTRARSCEYIRRESSCSLYLYTFYARERINESKELSEFQKYTKIRPKKNEACRDIADGISTR